MKKIETIKKWLYENSFPHFYALKIVNALFKKAEYDYAEMNELPDDLKQKLKKSMPIFSISATKKKQNDSTILVHCKNTLGEKIIIRSEYRKQLLHAYIQTHSEKGIELTSEEISDQVLLLNKLWGRSIDRIEIMSNADPLTNYDNLNDAITSLTDSITFNINIKNITVHTTGFVPGIRKMTANNDQFQLNIGLHNASEEWRQKNIQWGKTYSLAELIEVIDQYIRASRKKVTINYCLLKNENESEADARALINLLKGKLIAANIFSPQSEIHKKYHGVPIAQINNFRKILEINKIPLMPDLVYKNGDMYEQAVLKYHFK